MVIYGAAKKSMSFLPFLQAEHQFLDSQLLFLESSAKLLFDIFPRVVSAEKWLEYMKGVKVLCVLLPNV